MKKLFLEIERVMAKKSSISIRCWDYYYTYYSHVPVDLQLEILAKIANIDEKSMTSVKSFMGLKLKSLVSRYCSNWNATILNEICSISGVLSELEIEYLQEKARWMYDMLKNNNHDKLAEKWISYFQNTQHYLCDDFRFETIECEAFLTR